MMDSSIVVILPVYNGGEYVKLSVNSVLEQQYPHFSFIIIDDCSTDGSREWLRTLNDNRITYIENKTNQGLFKNLNQMIALSTAPLIKLWAQDDIMYPNCLAEFVAFHEAHPQIGFSYSQRDLIDEKGQVKTTSVVDKTPTIISTQLHARIAYYTGSVAGNIANTCINRTALNRVGPFNEAMKISADFDMWVRLAEYYETGFINKKIIQLRDHSGQLSRNEKYYINHVKEDLDVFRYLDGYIGKELASKGRKMLRYTKLSFYNTLMLKALFKAKFSLAGNYIKALNKYDNIFKIQLAFIRLKLLKYKPHLNLKN